MSGKATTSACGTTAKRSRASSRLQVVVVLGHERHQRLARVGPLLQVLRAAEAQRRADQQRALHARVAAVHERQVGAEATSPSATGAAGSRPRARSSAAATSSASAVPAPNAPWLVPCSLVVPRVLKRSTARSASAGSRQAALLAAGGCPSSRPGWAAGAGRSASPPGRAPAAARAHRPGSARRRCAASTARRRAGSTVLRADLDRHGTRQRPCPRLSRSAGRSCCGAP